jgi:hypothetical protein
VGQPTKAKADISEEPYDPRFDRLYRLYLYATVLGVVGGIVGVTFLVIQTIATKTAAEAARDSADAAIKSEKISRLAMIAGGRAYVHHQGFKVASHYDEKKGQIFWRIISVWVNSGNTPARNLEVYTGFELRDSVLPDDFPFSVPSDIQGIPMTLAPKGVVGGIGCDIFGRDILALKEGKKHLYIWGVCKYRDVFPDTGAHVTRFCSVGGTVMGDPINHWSESNKVEIGFATYHKHNCADDDCNN